MDAARTARKRQEAATMEKLAYSIAEVTEQTGLSRDLLYDEMRAGRLAYIKVGRRRIITAEQLAAFLSGHAA